MKFTKMHGCGNDYVYINCFEESFPQDSEIREKMVRQLSDRHFGIGGDGVIFICPSEKADAQMRMFNADGSESAMCGNGVRCVAKYVFDHGLAVKDVLQIDTLAGIKFVEIIEKKDGKAILLRVDMGTPILTPSRVPTTLLGTQKLETGEEAVVSTKIFVTEEFSPEITCVSMGNPHAIIFLDEEITDEHVFQYGPKMEKLEIFPQRANIEFIQVISAEEVIMRVWERGTGETLACGTGASAVCVAGVLAGKTSRNVLIHLPGGDLELEWDEKNHHVYMTGPAEEIFHGEIYMPDAL
ncbi:MAG: diaminopimelate epimerase [Planctomycetia bacterium]|nr:diaminopimelate epimerase [Planctomycetia bacterium]